MKAGQDILLFLFWLLAAIDIYAVINENETLHMVFKPTLITVLILVTCLAKANGYKKSLMLWALAFSLAGDIFLMFEKSNSLYFILGLGSFLVAHIFYIIFFVTVKRSRSFIIRKKPWIFLIVAAYVSTLLILIFPKLGSLKLPVLVYALAISLMLISAINTIRTIPDNAALLLVCGAVAFVVSDTLLAIDKFYLPLQSYSFSIMLTYCIAQFLIVSGFVKLSSLRFKE